MPVNNTSRLTQERKKKNMLIEMDLNGKEQQLFVFGAYWYECKRSILLTEKPKGEEDKTGLRTQRGGWASIGVPLFIFYSSHSNKHVLLTNSPTQQIQTLHQTIFSHECVNCTSSGLCFSGLCFSGLCFSGLCFSGLAHILLLICIA